MDNEKVDKFCIEVVEKINEWHNKVNYFSAEERKLAFDKLIKYFGMETIVNIINNPRG